MAICTSAVVCAMANTGYDSGDLITDLQAAGAMREIYAAGTSRHKILYDRAMTDAVPALKLKAQFTCGGELAIGPGKADLLDAIAATGSISAAGRRLGLSYRRAWLMADTMNRCWREPLVATAHGGARGGGARLTALGESVLRRYRDLEVELAAAANRLAINLTADLLTQPRPAHIPDEVRS